MLMINEREEMAQIFHEIDIDSDGVITVAEIEAKYIEEFKEAPTTT